MEAEANSGLAEKKSIFLCLDYFNSSWSDSCRHDKTSPVVTRALYVVLSSNSEARMWHECYSWKKSNHTTLEHCLWFWHHTKDPLFCRERGKTSSVIICDFKYIYKNELITLTCSYALLFSNYNTYYNSFPWLKVFFFNTNANSRPMWRAEGMKPKQEAGSPAPGPGQTFGQFRQSRVTSAFLRTRLISQRTSPRSPSKLKSALLCRLHILTIFSDRCGSATFCTSQKQTFGSNSAVYL